MKVKTLLAPLLIVSIIFLLIWYVYPAYSNGINGYKEQRIKLAGEKEKLDTIQNKSSNIDKLYSQMKTDSVSRGVIFSYIPEENKEEEVINSLNSISNDSGVLPVDITIQKASQSPVLPVTPGAAEGALPAPEGGLPGADPNVPVIVRPVADVMAVNFSVAGSYEQIKNLLSKLYRLNRFDKVSKMEILKLNKTEGENVANANSNVLQANMEVMFNYLKKPRMIDANDPVFSNASFDLKVVGNIKNKNDVGVAVPTIDQAGRSNPFLP